MGRVICVVAGGASENGHSVNSHTRLMRPIVTLESVDWFNTRRLLEPIGYVLLRIAGRVRSALL
jgi:hypothetical protein